MRLMITGCGGMLADAVQEAANAAGHEVYCYPRGDVDIANSQQVTIALGEFADGRSREIDVVINCAGRIPGSKNRMGGIEAGGADFMYSNALGPYVLATQAKAVGARVVHVSTDCVYAGHPDVALIQLPSSDAPDATDPYGVSKAAGEVNASHVMNVRTSFVGPTGGFLKWLLDSENSVHAWAEAFWNGGTVNDVARHLVWLAAAPRTFFGRTIHLASPTYVTKAWIIDLFRRKLDLGISVSEVNEPKVWRVLRPDIALPPVEAALTRLADELVSLREDADDVKSS